MKLYIVVSILVGSLSLIGYDRILFAIKPKVPESYLQVVK